jgi:hypothetical protein
MQCCNKPSLYNCYYIVALVFQSAFVNFISFVTFLPCFCNYFSSEQWLINVQWRLKLSIVISVHHMHVNRSCMYGDLLQPVYRFSCQGLVNDTKHSESILRHWVQCPADWRDASSLSAFSTSAAVQPMIGGLLSVICMYLKDGSAVPSCNILILFSFYT